MTESDSDSSYSGEESICSHCDDIKYYDDHYCKLFCNGNCVARINCVHCDNEPYNYYCDICLNVHCIDCNCNTICNNEHDDFYFIKDGVYCDICAEYIKYEILFNKKFDISNLYLIKILQRKYKLKYKRIKASRVIQKGLENWLWKPDGIKVRLLLRKDIWKNRK